MERFRLYRDALTMFRLVTFTQIKCVKLNRTGSGRASGCKKGREMETVRSRERATDGETDEKEKKCDKDGES